MIEAGFPVASVGDFEAVEKIAKSVGQLKDPPIICGLSRALKNDISVCYDAIKGAKFPRIHTFIATSDIHMEQYVICNAGVMLCNSCLLYNNNTITRNYHTHIYISTSLHLQ